MQMPFADRRTCTIRQAMQASGLGHTKLYEFIKDGRLAALKVDGRRLIVVESLLQLLTPPEDKTAKRAAGFDNRHDRGGQNEAVGA
jgi:hypothetical protein